MSMKPPDTDCIPLAVMLHNRLDSPGHSELSVIREYWGDKSKDEIRERLRKVCDRLFANYLSAK